MWCQRPSLTDNGSWATWSGAKGERHAEGREGVEREVGMEREINQERDEINCGMLQTRTAIRRVRASKHQPSVENSPDEPMRHKI